MTALQDEVDRVNACLAEATTRVRARAYRCGSDCGNFTFVLTTVDDVWTYDDDVTIAKALVVAGAQEVCTDCFVTNAAEARHRPDPRYADHTHCGSCEGCCSTNDDQRHKETKDTCSA